MRAFTEEQEQFRAAYRRFLEAEIAPNIPRWRDAGIVEREAFAKAGDLGFLMIWPDEKYGGIGDPDFRFDQIILEEAVRAGCGEWYATLHSRLVGPYIDRYGSEEQKARFLPKCVNGQTILAIAMTESGAGSDLTGMRTTLRPNGSHYLLNGSKTYISNGINADVVIVAAKADPDGDPHALTLVLVERGMPGFERGRNLEKMGLKAQDTAELFFENVEIPRENVLGKPGHGFRYLMEGLAEERLIAATAASANARRAFDITRDYVLDRTAFGRPVASFQNTQFQMADMDAEIDVVQVFIDYCVELINRGELTANMAAKAKLRATDAEWKMLDLGVQLHGGAGYMAEYPICSMFQDARVNRIQAGSSEVMKLIIGRDALSDSYQSLLK